MIKIKLKILNIKDISYGISTYFKNFHSFCMIKINLKILKIKDIKKNSFSLSLYIYIYI